MIKRAFHHHPARITFTKDFRELPLGLLEPGTELTLVYDAERLPNERSMKDNLPDWSITAYVKFSDGDSAHEVPLHSETGVTVTKEVDNVGGGTMLIGKIDIPEDADELIIWFVNSGASGAVHYDSNFGANYRFRFVTEDITVVSAVVSRDAQTPYSGFGVEVAAGKDVTSVAVHYRVVNNPPDQPFEGQNALQPTGQNDNEGRKLWSIFGVSVPYRAVIAFAIIYVADGNTYTDDNNHRQYLAPQPENTLLH